MTVISRIIVGEIVKFSKTWRRSVSIYNLLVDTSSLICQACFVAERVGFNFEYCRTGFPHLLENLKKYSTPGKIMEFCKK